MAKGKVHPAFTNISVEFLRDVLRLPSDWRITGMSFDAQRGEVRIDVAGKYIPVPDGGEMIGQIFQEHCEHCDVRFISGITWKSMDSLKSTS